METGENGTTSILVIDDDALFSEAVADALRGASYRVKLIESGNEALLHALRHHPDLILLDLSLPDIYGMDLCHVLRQHIGGIPIIFLTAHRAPQDVIAGLDAGADDYITKPCNLDELLARVRAVLRRISATHAAEPEQVEVGNVAVDAARHEVRVRGERVDLSPKEFNLLWLLMTNAGRVIPRARIIDTVWGADFYGDVKALDVYIRLLRRKIEADPDHPRLIQTVRGIGYSFALAAAPPPALPGDTRQAAY